MVGKKGASLFDDHHANQLIHYLKVDSTVVDDAVVVDVHDVKNVHTYKKEKGSSLSSPSSKLPA